MKIFAKKLENKLEINSLLKYPWCTWINENDADIDSWVKITREELQKKFPNLDISSIQGCPAFMYEGKTYHIMSDFDIPSIKEPNILTKFIKKLKGQ